MISDLDETLKQLLVKKGGLDPAEVDISFDMPDREWSASVSKPTVNLYLYDIHENRELRDNEWSVAHSNGLATRRRPPIRVDVSYLITVWTNDTADQHRLLGHILATLFRYPELPEELLKGSLIELPWPVRTFTAQLDGVLRNTSDFWSALDNQLKPSINYVINIPIELDVTETAPEVKTKVFKFNGGNGAADEIVEIVGSVHRKGKPDQVVADATLVLKELQMTASTDEEGRYAFPRLSSGSYTLEISVPGEKERRKVPLAVPGASYDIEL